jgi:two-component system, OmpR family, response regulator
MRILVVEDEDDIASIVRAKLQQQGYIVDVVGSVGEAEAAVTCAAYTLIILDRRLPDGDGLQLVPRIRQIQSETPVIMLTALDSVSAKVAGLNSGADDYLSKPFDSDELLARMRAVLRRPSKSGSPPVVVGRLSFSPETRTVMVGEDTMVVPRRELALLEALILRARRVVQREVLLNEMFGYADDIQSNTLDAHVSRLRGRLKSANAGVVIHPVRGVGYLLDLGSSTE